MSPADQLQMSPDRPALDVARHFGASLFLRRLSHMLWPYHTCLSHMPESLSHMPESLSHMPGAAGGPNHTCLTASPPPMSRMGSSTPTERGKPGRKPNKAGIFRQFGALRTELADFEARLPIPPKPLRRADSSGSGPPRCPLSHMPCPLSHMPDRYHTCLTAITHGGGRTGAEMDPGSARHPGGSRGVGPAPRRIEGSSVCRTGGLIGARPIAPAD